MSDPGDKILGSIRKAPAILRGESDGELVVHVPPEFDVRRCGASSVCRSRGSPKASASASPRCRAGSRAVGRPDGPAHVLLKVIEHDPEADSALWLNSCGRAGSVSVPMLDCKS